MLFSNADVARFVNQWFEPVWESVRPVPLVKIDFGNGTVITRTLHGNIATYGCTADGQVLDVLPGIYDPKAYLAQLGQLRLLHNYADQEGTERREARLREYHEKQVAVLKQNQMPLHLVNMADISKAKVEGGIKAVLAKGSAPRPKQPEKSNAPGFDNKADLASWKLLAEDTEVNETQRRLQIHGLLAQDGLVKPEKLTKRVYKDVLHSDLDDPYLGLGKVLFDGYAFRKEDAAK